HRLLLEQLGAEQPKDPLQRLRWELKVAAHRIVLDPARALELMRSFFGTAVEEEASAVLEGELARQADGCALGGVGVPEADREKLRALADPASFVPLRELLWGHPHVTRNALSTATVVVLVLALGMIGAMKVEGVQKLLLRLEETRIVA